MSHLLLIILCVASLVYPAAGLGGEPAKNIIFMVPDGMGLAQVTAARIFKNGPGGAPLALETLERVGYQRTYSKNSTVTDSAAAASAWACGEKFNNGEVCFHRETGSYSPTILELAKGMGKATGLVVTSQITDATPASFAAHVANRKCQNEIGRQYIQVVRPHVILGGGRWKMDADPATDGDSPGCPIYGKDLEEEAARTGYRVVHTGKELEEALNEGPREILGLFSNEGMTPAYKRTPETTEPSLAEMTRAALTVLEKERKGFFLLVEGSQVDWANHENNLAYQVPELLAARRTPSSSSPLTMIREALLSTGPRKVSQQKGISLPLNRDGRARGTRAATFPFGAWDREVSGLAGPSTTPTCTGL